MQIVYNFLEMSNLFTGKNKNKYFSMSSAESLTQGARHL